MMQPFEQVEHTADYAIIARGGDLRELIENAGRGMISLLVDTQAVAASRQVRFTAVSYTHLTLPTILLV